MSKTIIFKCDHCCIETVNSIFSESTQIDVPRKWISMSVKAIENRINGSNLQYTTNNELHYCSKTCFERAFFHPEVCTATTT